MNSQDPKDYIGKTVFDKDNQFVGVIKGSFLPSSGLGIVCNIQKIDCTYDEIIIYFAGTDYHLGNMNKGEHNAVGSI